MLFDVVYSTPRKTESQLSQWTASKWRRTPVWSLLTPPWMCWTRTHLKMIFSLPSSRSLHTVSGCLSLFIFLNMPSAHSNPQSVTHSWPAFRKHPLFATLPLQLAPVWLIDVLVIVPLPLTRELVESPWPSELHWLNFYGCVSRCSQQFY